MKSRYVILSIRLFIISAVLVAVFAVVTSLNRPVPKVDINASGTYVRGCPEKDCFPSVDKPQFLTAEEGDSVWADDEEVIGLVYRGIAKAYPLKIINYHHIVNDWFEDEPIAVTRCALCDTSIAYRRIINGKETEFGVLGTLLDSCLVLYDRDTNTSWLQIGGDAIEGKLTGEKLKSIEMEQMTWGQWKEMHPDTLVLSKNTGFFKGYETNIYKISNYTKNEEIHFPIRINDARLHPKAVVFGVVANGRSKAYPKGEVAKIGIVNDEVGGKDMLIYYNLKNDLIRVFSRKIDGRILNFEQSDGGVFDLETHSRWDFDGKAVSGEYRGKELDRLESLEIYWFAWSAYYPETDLFLIA